MSRQAISRVCNIESCEQKDKIQVMKYINSSDNLSPCKTQKVDSNKSIVNKGAGSILFTKLVQVGWKFPRVQLTDADEKYLFEIEVRIKLLHPSSLSMLRDILCDFPAQVLLSRFGLLQAVLEILGGTQVQNNGKYLNIAICHVFHVIRVLWPTNVGILFPVEIMSWLRLLLKKCIDGYHTIKDGNGCSVVQELESQDASESKDGSPSLGLQLVRCNMVSNRLPIR